MDSRIPTHDDFVRSILANNEIAIAYFTNFLPASLVEKLDFSTLVQLPDTYLSEELRKTISDIVYSCNLKNGKEVKISLLIEHKSYYDKWTVIQIGSYIFSAFLKQIQNKEILSPVIPILLYHGKQKWEHQMLSDLFVGLDEELESYLPSFNYVFNNLGQLSDRQIESLTHKFLAASILALKHAFDKRWFETNAEKLFVHASNEETGLRRSLIFYVFSRANLPENVLNSLPEPIKSEVMNTFDVYFEKGMEQGLEKGLERGLEKGLERGLEKGLEKGFVQGIERGKFEEVRNLIVKLAFTDEQAAEIAEVSVEFVRNVRASLEKK